MFYGQTPAMGMAKYITNAQIAYVFKMTLFVLAGPGADNMLILALIHKHLFLRDHLQSFAEVHVLIKGQSLYESLLGIIIVIREIA
jgi:hypothetical protein